MSRYLTSETEDVAFYYSWDYDPYWRGRIHYSNEVIRIKMLKPGSILQARQNWLTIDLAQIYEGNYFFVIHKKIATGELVFNDYIDLFLLSLPYGKIIRTCRDEQEFERIFDLIG